MANIQLSEITFKKLYSQIVFKLKKTYNRANSSFTLASPFGQVLTVITDLFGLNMSYNNHIRRQFDLNDTLNQDTKTIRSLARIGQYNPNRGSCASGVLKVKTKSGVDITNDIKGGKIVFKNKSKIKNNKNSLEYILDLNQDELIFSLSNQTPILISIIQGSWQTKIFTGTGDLNQSFGINSPDGKEIDNFRFKVFINDELWSPKKHKFDMLLNEKAYVPLTGFTGGLDIIFGNGDEGLVPALGSIITVDYLLTDGKEGNVVDPLLNEFKFIDSPKDSYGNDIDTESYFDIDTETNITFGADGDTADFLKKILPFASSNFVLASTDQYKFFLKRIGIFSIIDVYSSKRNDTQLIYDIYSLAKTNTDLLNKLANDDNSSTLRQLVSQNLKHISDIKKLLLSEGGDNVVNIFLIPDIRIFYGSEKDTNYFNIDINAFILDTDEKNRVLNYLSKEGTQTILNEVKIQDPIIKRYSINITLRLYDNAIDDNVNNAIINAVSDYFISNNRRDRIPPSDLVRIIDGLDGVDSVTVEYISELNENYHKEFLIKSEEFKNKNGRQALDSDIIMSDGVKYNALKTIGLDSILGDILIDKTDLPIIRGGFSDRYNNQYNMQPGQGLYSSVNILILPGRTKSKQLN
jgi:hypothetical protein